MKKLILIITLLIIPSLCWSAESTIYGSSSGSQTPWTSNIAGAGYKLSDTTINLKAGTATALTAPLKFTSGTLMTTPEIGAMEFLGDTWCGTVTTGAVRKNFLFSDGSAALLTSFPTLNQDTTGKSAKTDALNSATTVVNVASATAPSLGQVLTATSSTAATWQTPPAVTSVTGTAPIASSGGTTPAISLNDAGVTYAKIQNVSATDKILGRVTAGAGVVEEIATTGTGDVVRGTSPTITTPIITTIVPGADFTISQNSAAGVFRSVEAGALNNSLLLKAGNLGVGTSTFGTSARAVFALTTFTAPTTSPADMVQLYSQDLVTAGKAGLKLREEGGIITSIGHHVNRIGGTAPALTSCGTSPTIATGSDDHAGIFTIGATGTGCVITFATAYTNVPSCIVIAETASNFTSLTKTASAITVVGSPGIFNYRCVGLGE